MADNGYSDDISALWGAQQESALEPARLPARDVHGPEAGPPGSGTGNGNGHGREVGDQGPSEGVARLAEALAAHQADVATKAELARVRSELEGAFTHQLAVALYDLLAASNERFTSAEGQLDRRLDDIAARLARSVEIHTERLLAAVDAQQRTAAEAQQAVRADVAAVEDHLRRRLDGPLDGLGVFQRDIRHEIGRLADAVTAQGAESSRRDEVRADHLASVHGELSQRIEGVAAERGAEMGDLSARITAVGDEVATLHREIAELRHAVDRPRRRGGRWSRSD